MILEYSDEPQCLLLCYNLLTIFLLFIIDGCILINLGWFWAIIGAKLQPNVLASAFLISCMENIKPIWQHWHQLGSHSLHLKWCILYFIHDRILSFHISHSFLNTWTVLHKQKLRYSDKENTKFLAPNFLSLYTRISLRPSLLLSLSLFLSLSHTPLSHSNQ